MSYRNIAWTWVALLAVFAISSGYRGCGYAAYIDVSSGTREDRWYVLGMPVYTRTTELPPFATPPSAPDWRIMDSQPLLNYRHTQHAHGGNYNQLRLLSETLEERPITLEQKREIFREGLQIAARGKKLELGRYVGEQLGITHDALEKEAGAKGSNVAK